ncbi:helix-turn-helix transcriptional regulator [Taibaiella lutea]|uniref:Helix-turn-helix transcriptional regulator n=1 Tax=Taibaiella lutea TaxID=2608001 RepID=A0A5M6CMH5_9BACT|nr:helix-turn-helix transcriptional regulator [Taibaiella lutea]
MDIQSKIGERIKEIRTSLNLTQEAVAYKAEVDRSFMNHVENGKRNISMRTLEKIICYGLEITFQDFFNHESFKSKGRLRK